MLLLDSVYPISDRKLDHEISSTETPIPTDAKIEERAPVGDLPLIKSKANSTSAPSYAEKEARQDFTTTPETTIRLRSQDGSTLRIEAIGRTRRFYFVETHNGFPAKSGDIAFEGVREGPSISGRAYQFAEKCPPLAYRVKGTVNADETTVTMAGRKPQRDPKCRVTGYTNDELIFNLTGRL